jgi:hypothetical protein
MAGNRLWAASSPNHRRRGQNRGLLGTSTASAPARRAAARKGAKSSGPTKLVLKARRHPHAVADHTTVPASGEGGQREERHEEHTSYWVEALCDVYFEKIKACRSPGEYRQALEGLPLDLRGSKNIGYAEAFRHVATASQIHGYRIFLGTLRQVLRCRDGFESRKFKRHYRTSTLGT